MYRQKFINKMPQKERSERLKITFLQGWQHATINSLSNNGTDYFSRPKYHQIFCEEPNRTQHFHCIRTSSACMNLTNIPWYHRARNWLCTKNHQTDHHGDIMAWKFGISDQHWNTINVSEYISQRHMLW